MCAGTAVATARRRGAGEDREACLTRPTGHNCPQQIDCSICGATTHWPILTHPISRVEARHHGAVGCRKRRDTSRRRAAAPRAPFATAQWRTLRRRTGWPGMRILIT
eukprot:364905-Chlamydomonas_euryale.AAC.5